MDFEQSRPEEQPFSTPGHGEEKELTRQSPDPSATTDESAGTPRKGDGGASPEEIDPRDAEKAARSASFDASQGAPRLDSETSAALAAKNASFGMSDGTEETAAGMRPALARVSNARFLQGRTWYFLLSVNILLAIVLSLTLVWVSIERMDANYFINLERAKLRDKQSLHGKLEVERERLLSPYELRVNAERLGMKAPEPGQIRRMDLKKPVP